MICPHDILEMDKATNAGMCPLCMVARIERLRAALQDIAEDPYAIDGGAAEIARTALAGKEGLRPEPTQRGKCKECGRFFDPPTSQCPTCAEPLDFPYLRRAALAGKSHT